MAARGVATETLKASEARAEWGRILETVRRRKARVLVEKAGVPVAAIVSPQDLERLRRWDAEREEPFKILDEFRRAFADESPEEAERQVALALEEVRAENRKRAAQSPG